MCPSAVKGCIIILPSSRVPSLLCVCVGLPRIDEPHLLCFYSSLCCSTQALKTIASLLFYYHCCSTYRLSGICCCFNIDQFSSGDKIQISRIKALFNILSKNLYIGYSSSKSEETSMFMNNVNRLGICRDHRDRRSCKIFVSCVNFSRKQRSFLYIL